jgi:methylthioribose-1-phosphate isomerase
VLCSATLRWRALKVAAGCLATGGEGTALGVIAFAHKRRSFTVYADETRPLLQGSRLTAWELKEMGIPVRLLCDSAAGALLESGSIGAVIVGADRIASNGDVANKIGTYSLAILAHFHNVPFFVAAPFSSFDPSIASGKEIVIEQRHSTEVTRPMDVQANMHYAPH